MDRFAKHMLGRGSVRKRVASLSMRLHRRTSSVLGLDPPSVSLRSSDHRAIHSFQASPVLMRSRAHDRLSLSDRSSTQVRYGASPLAHTRWPGGVIPVSDPDWFPIIGGLPVFSAGSPGALAPTGQVLVLPMPEMNETDWSDCGLVGGALFRTLARWGSVRRLLRRNRIPSIISGRPVATAERIY